MAAAEDPTTYFAPIAGPGRVSVDSDGRSTFVSGEGSHYVLDDTPTASQEQRIVDRIIELVSAAP